MGGLHHVTAIAGNAARNLDFYALLQLRPEILSGGILYRAMAPIDEPVQARLDAKPILIISGKHDMIVPLEMRNDWRPSLRTEVPMWITSSCPLDTRGETLVSAHLRDSSVRQHRDGMLQA
jgi:hypothetical protein